LQIKIMNPRIIDLLQKKMNRKEFLTFTGLAVASLFGITGVITELLSHAATPYASSEAESGVRSGSATLLSNATSSEGEAVEFGTSVTTATPDFADNFTSFNTSNWYPCYPYALGGEVDEGSGGSWNAGTTALNGVVYDPFQIVSDSTATDGSLVRINCRRTTSAEQSAAGGKAWVGGIMISQEGWTSGYVEWRARFPAAGNGTGMWPALWMFGQTQSSSTQDKASRGASEMDMLEIFGVPGTWNTTIHDVSSSGAVGNDRVYSGSTDNGWHTYGIEWDGESVLDFFYDGTQMSSGTAAQAANFNGQSMCARMNYTITDDASWTGEATNSSTPSPLYFDVDYFYHYTARPGTTTTTPLPVAGGVPANASLPTISGSLTVGDVLTGTVGSWTNSPTAYTYQWHLGDANIVGAYSSTYTLVEADVGSTIGLYVTATNSSGTGSATSNSTGVVVAASGGGGTTGGSGGVLDFTTSQPIGPTGTWTLNFSDDFTGTTLDTSKWVTKAPDGTVGWGDQEWYDSSAVSVSNSQLVITMTSQSNGSRAFKSGCVATGVEGSPLYYLVPNTYIEADITVPPASAGSLWPAFWGFGPYWPPEIDFFEFGYDSTGSFQGSTNGLPAPNWHPSSSSQANSGHATYGTGDARGNPHNYGMWWNGSTCQFYFDGVHYPARDISGITAAQQFIIFSSQTLGGSVVTPNYYKVDWIRVWKAS
jgi:hypothetical protein